MDNFKIFDGKKYMWDGVEYETEAAAEEKIAAYRADNFATKLVKEEEKFLAYTRRVVTDIEVEGEP